MEEQNVFYLVYNNKTLYYRDQLYRDMKHAERSIKAMVGAPAYNNDTSDVCEWEIHKFERACK